MYGLAHPDLPAEFPPLRSLGTLSTNLPAELTSFIGRSTELAELAELLGQVRLLTITGAGGCGKTRLARHAAAATLDGHLDGVWWVELARLEDAAVVPAALIAAIGVRELPGQGPLGTLVAYLRARRALLILDNCEHVSAACAQLAEALLRGCPSLTVLATSRAPLGVPGETAWRVPSLSLPADASRAYRAPLEVLYESDAVRLFVDRARQVRPDFELTQANAPGIAQICRELDGIPLAVELAAAQVRTLASAQIAHRLGDRFQLLTGGSRAAVPPIRRGTFADAEAFAQRSLALGEQVGDVNVRISHHVQMAVLRALQGRPQESAAYFEPAGREHPPELARVVNLAFRCIAGDRTGIKEAFPLVWRARAQIPRPFWLIINGSAVTLLAAHSGALHEGAAIYELVRPYERRWISSGRDAVAPMGPAAYYLGVLAAALSRFDAAARHFEMAIDDAQRIGSRPFLALTQGAYGAMLARRGATLDRQRARQLLADALQAAQQLGMNQLYDDVVAARAGMPADPAWLDSPLDLLADSAAVFRREGDTGPSVSSGSSFG